MKTFDQVNKELNLENSPDWGIINGVASRTKEFIDYYNDNLALLDYSVKPEFLELVLTSMNEAIIENEVDNELQCSFDEFILPFINSDDMLLYGTFIRWIHLSDQKEFPIALMLKEKIDSTS